MRLTAPGCLLPLLGLGTRTFAAAWPLPVARRSASNRRSASKRHPKRGLPTAGCCAWPGRSPVAFVGVRSCLSHGRMKRGGLPYRTGLSAPFESEVSQCLHGLGPWVVCFLIFIAVCRLRTPRGWGPQWTLLHQIGKGYCHNYLPCSRGSVQRSNGFFGAAQGFESTPSLRGSVVEEVPYGEHICQAAEASRSELGLRAVFSPSLDGGGAPRPQDRRDRDSRS